MTKTHILIADDHQMFRDGIRALLEKIKHLEVTCEASTGDEILNCLNSFKVDVILMDIDLKGSSGIEASQMVKEKFPTIKILAISMHGEHNYILKMIEAGATGYILKNAGKDEMLTAIESVAQGGSYFSNEVSIELFKQLQQSGDKSRQTTEIPLTKREVEILRLIAQEFSNLEIAEKLFISNRTVDTHRRNLIEKLGVKNTAGLVRYALKNGLAE